MFICNVCDKNVPPGIKCTRIIGKRRQKSYPFRSGVNRVASWKEDKAEKIASTNDTGGRGWEIAVELKTCPTCAKNHVEQLNQSTI